MPGTIGPLLERVDTGDQIRQARVRAFCMATQVVPAPVSIVKYCGVPLGSTIIVVPSLKDWAAEKVRTLEPDVLLTVPDPDIRFRTLDAGIAPSPA
jgi:hypothetical protein